MSQSPRIYGCKWDYCETVFKTLPDLDRHLQHTHIAVSQPEEVFSKRRKLSPGVYIVLEPQRLADQIPMRYSQTTGDITTTTISDLTFDNLEPPYPPSFPSQPEALSFSELFKENEEEEKWDGVSLEQILPRKSHTPPPASPPILPFLTTQYDLPTSSSPFNPPTQNFSQKSNGSNPSQSNLSAKSTNPTMAPPPPKDTFELDYNPKGKEKNQKRTSSVSSGVSLSFGFGQSPIKPRQPTGQKSESGRNISNGSDLSSDSIGFVWGLGGR